MAKALGAFQTYISTKEEFVLNFGERRRNGKMIGSEFAESNMNYLFSKKMVKNIS